MKLLLRFFAYSSFLMAASCATSFPDGAKLNTGKSNSNCNICHVSKKDTKTFKTLSGLFDKRYGEYIIPLSSSPWGQRNPKDGRFYYQGNTAYVKEGSGKYHKKTIPANSGISTVENSNLLFLKTEIDEKSFYNIYDLNFEPVSDLKNWLSYDGETYFKQIPDSPGLFSFVLGGEIFPKNGSSMKGLTPSGMSGMFFSEHIVDGKKVYGIVDYSGKTIAPPKYIDIASTEDESPFIIGWEGRQFEAHERGAGSWEKVIRDGKLKGYVQAKDRSAAGDYKIGLLATGTNLDEVISQVNLKRTTEKEYAERHKRIRETNQAESRSKHVSNGFKDCMAGGSLKTCTAKYPSASTYDVYKAKKTVADKKRQNAINAAYKGPVSNLSITETGASAQRRIGYQHDIKTMKMNTRNLKKWSK